MKRSHGLVSATPLFMLKKNKTASRQDGLLGTPVEGLTGKTVSERPQEHTPASWQPAQRVGFDLLQIDTPDSDDRPQRAIPETTQRRLEGFCLSTPLSLSQAAEQEVCTHVFSSSSSSPGEVNTPHAICCLMLLHKP